MTDSFGPDDSNVPSPEGSPETPEATTPIQPPTETEMTSVDPAAEAEPPAKSRRRWIIPAVAAAVVAGLAGGATWATLQLMSSGDPVASALPDSTVAFVSIDLDPSASQKIEAIKVMRKIPALADHLDFDLSTSDDLRKWIIEAMAKDAGCTDFDYSKQVEPWIGSRAAFGGAENADGTVVPFAVLQVTDQGKAKDAWENDTTHCDDVSDSDLEGLAFAGEYALVAETQEDADFLAAEAEKAPLEADADYQTWMGRIGDPGIITAYVSPDAMKVALDEMRASGDLAEFDSMSGFGPFEEAFAKFNGAVAVVRFGDSGVELEAIVDGAESLTGLGADGAAPVAGLPDTTALAMGLALPDGWETDLWDAISQDVPDFDRGQRQFERETGLTLPDDLATLFGSGFALSVDKSLDVASLASSPGFPDPTTIPVGLRIEGDAAGVMSVVDTINGSLAYMGFRLEAVAGDGVVGISASRAYASQLSEDGGLGDTAAYQQAVRQGVDTPGVEYFDLGAIGGWIEAAASGDPSAQEVADNLDAFVAVGVSSWQEDELGHMLVRVNLK